MTEGILYIFWSLFGPFFLYFGYGILYFGYGILYFGYGVLISLMGSFIRNGRGIFVSFLIFLFVFFGTFLVPKSYILAMESYILAMES